MTNFSQKIITQLQSLRARDFLKALGVVGIIVPLWLIYHVVNNPEKLSALVEFRTGTKITGTVLGCQKLSAVYRTKPSFQVIKESISSNSSVLIGQYAEQRTPFTDDEAREICIELTRNEKTLQNKINRDIKKDATPQVK